jgi:hypothetical protein
MIVGWQVISNIKGPKQILAEGILEAMAGGTFLYVSLFNILADPAKQKMKMKYKILHVLSGSLGFAAMSLLAVWT